MAETKRIEDQLKRSLEREAWDGLQHNLYHGGQIAILKKAFHTNIKV
jgi:hypothetical protein